MPLTECSECGEEISTETETCPHCGVEFEQTTVWERGCAEAGCGPWLVFIPVVIGRIAASVVASIILCNAAGGLTGTELE